MSYKPKVRLAPLGVIGRDLLVDNEEEKMSESTRDETKNTQIDFAVGDVHSRERGSGARANSGKVSFSALPLHLLAGTARVLMGGKLKYAPWNWAKGMPWSVCYDCTMRHMMRWWYLGEEKDAESGEHHLDHAICNLLMLRHYIITHKKGDDRPDLDVTAFGECMDDFSQSFSVEDYLDRNPAIREKLDDERRQGIDRF